MFKTDAERNAYNIGISAGKRMKEMEHRGRPPSEEIPDWEALTVGDVCEFSKKRHSSLNVDSVVHPFQIPPGTLVWDGTHRIAVFWVTGNSEGYYVHVETTACPNPKTLMIGKCWDVESAETMVRDLTRFIWDEWRN